MVCQLRGAADRQLLLLDRVAEGVVEGLLEVSDAHGGSGGDVEAGLRSGDNR